MGQSNWGVDITVAQFPEYLCSYGSLVPVRLDGVLGAGRHISCDAKVALVSTRGPQRWITVRAAALAAGSGAQPRELSVQLIQHELLEQGAYLLSSIENRFDTQQPNSTSDVAVATGRCGV